MIEPIDGRLVETVATEEVDDDVTAGANDTARPGTAPEPDETLEELLDDETGAA